MTTNVPDILFTPTGLVLPEESAVLAGVRADYNDAFGGNLNPAVETPQGQLASSTAAIIADKNEQFALFVNQVNPDTASGFMQDAIARLYFLDRKPGTPTSVVLDCMGAFGTLIDVGAMAQDTSGNLYMCTQAGTIPPGGTVSLPFVCTVDGPTACPANTVTTIYKAIVGLDSVNNPLAGVPGNFVESQAAFAYRREQSVALNGKGSLPSIYAAVFACDGVIDVYVTENTTNSTITKGATNYPLVEHSLYVAAVGGTPEQIAKAIWLKKDVGCDYNGNTSVVVTDESGYLPPLPTYTVKYQIPASLPIKFAVSIRNSTDLPLDIVMQVKAAITSAFIGEDGGQRVRIGSEVFASRFVNAVSKIAPSVLVLSIKIGTTTPALLDSLLIGIDQAPTVTDADITVALV